MDSSLSATSRKSYDLPKPETGLAEWTSKIKALQKEVDADEEAEQKRLEEEIAAARQARLRRSRGNSASSRVNSAEISTNKEQLNFPNNINDTSANDTQKSTTERENNQESALRKLMGRNDVYNPDKISTSTRATTGKADATPLAAFIGGTATGPRLNRHAPQQDAHDPAQYIQPDLSTPHPLFGRGGVAMPGMAAKNNKLAASEVGTEHSERYRPSTLTSAKSTSSLANSNLEKTQNTSQRDPPDLSRRSFTSSPNPVPLPTVRKQNEKEETSTGKSNYESPRNQYAFSASPRPLSSSKSSSYLPKKEELVAGDTHLSLDKVADTSRFHQTSFSSAPKSTSSSKSTPPQNLTTSLTKTVESWSAQNSFSSAPKLPTSSNLSSYKMPEATVRDPSSLPTKVADKDTLRSGQNTFSSTPKYNLSSKTASYLPKKEEIVDRSPSPTKSADAFRSTSSTPSRPLPSYIGSNPLKPNSAAVGNSSTSSSAADTPLRRLMETNKVHNPDKLTDTSRKSVAERAQAVSLAAFMGGNGTGIRLNRHAPQQDAHDPTQFVQYDTSAPHPIFGKGGIAMPGMTARNLSKSSDAAGSESSERYRPSTTTRPTWPPVSSSRVDKEERPVSPQKTGNRERTTSAPSSQVPNTLPSSSDWSSSNKVAGRQSPTKEIRALTPARDRTISNPSYTNNHNTFISPSPSLQSSVSTSSLSRPIQPIPKSSSLSPHISGTTSASPAFQKPAAQKDLTPSISRLQGRGFVQNMVKASAQFETSSSTSPSDKTRPVSAGGRKGSVLDRWQPNVLSSSPTKSSFPPYSNAMRKSTTYESNERVSERPRTTKSPTPFDAPHTIKSVASLPSLTKAATVTTSRPLTQEPADAAEQYARPRTPGLGSATTMVLIKPNKSSSDLTQLPHVDELGVKHDSWRSPQMDNIVPTEAPPSSKKPLIHPTKDRARKPRKHSASQGVPGGGSSLSTSINHASTYEEFDRTRPEPQTVIANDDTVSLQERLDESLLTNKDASLHNEQIAADNENAQTSLSLSLSLKDESTSEIVTPEAVKSSTPPRTFVPSSPSTPVKHTRIPSTGNRATVMEVAQALLDYPTHEPTSKDIDISPKPTAGNPDREPSLTGSKTATPLLQIQAEKHKSSYEKYSAFILPSLKEEATPTPSPAGTLTRVDVKVEFKNLKHEPEISQSTLQNFEKQVTQDLDAIPLPHIDYSKLLNPSTRPSTKMPDAQTVSMEVLAITGTTATPLTTSLDIFYENEILAVIHRTKSKSSGLASTSVWCWLGRKSILGDREDRKLQELAKRYGTSAKIIHQLAEPPELIEVLGGRLSIRQGTRTHWSSENTTMHLVRSLHGNILIDEHDLNIQNLCSAFSYCLTVLGSVYVWHGRGSTQKERDTALKYVETFSKDLVLPIVLLEGEDDNDDMFWMILGDDDFAKADYWQWRKASPITDPSLWKIDATNEMRPLVPVDFISMEREFHNSIYIFNCIWEFYLVVGKEARSNRRTIKFALDLVTKLAMEASSSRPYVPTVHVLILPSQIPLDLRLGIRDLDEAWMNDGEIPDHMNLIHSSEAVNHLSTYSWEQAALRDRTMLPLGVS